MLLPDGTNVKGYLDGDGFSRLQNIDQPGSASIGFPKRDPDSWDRQSSPPADPGLS